MSGQITVIETASFTRPGGKRLSVARFLRRWRLALSAIVFMATLLVSTAGIFQGVADTAPSDDATAGSKQSTTSGSSCPTNEANYDTALFARCPGFSLNFADQPNGSINTTLFNVYTNQPVVNQEVQLYTSNAQNLRVENGKLDLEALNDPQQGFKYTSARVDTKGKEDFLYGKLEINATLPDTVGAWPAIWMLPSNPKYAKLSPPTDFSRYLNDGEIDIAESVGLQPHVVYGIAHARAHSPDGPNTGYYNTVAVPNNDRTFHTYEVDWTPTSLTFAVDGQPYFSISKQPGADYRTWPYDQQFYLILNLALGGSWGGRDAKQFPPDGVDSNKLPATMQVQSIRYYPYVGK